MTDSSTAELRSPHSQSAVRTPPPAAAGEAPADPSGAAPAAADPAYSIRVAETPGAPCAQCSEATGSGPVGYHGDLPICDLCLLEGSAQLGMVLAVVSVVRAYGSVEHAPSAERHEALHELGAFARIYEKFAAKSGPMRWILRRLWVH